MNHRHISDEFEVHLVSSFIISYQVFLKKHNFAVNKPGSLEEYSSISLHVEAQHYEIGYCFSEVLLFSFLSFCLEGNLYWPFHFSWLWRKIFNASFFFSEICFLKPLESKINLVSLVLTTTVVPAGWKKRVLLWLNFC